MFCSLFYGTYKVVHYRWNFIMRKFMVFFVVCASFMALNAASTEAARQFILKVTTEALDIVNHDSMSPEEKRQKLSESISKNLDLERIARIVFSTPKYKYKSLAKEDQLKAQQYIGKELLNYYATPGKITAMIGSELKKNKDAKIEKFKVEEKGENFSVTTKFMKNGQESIVIVWITDGKKISDVEILSISQTMTIKSQKIADIGDTPLMQYIDKEMA